MTMIADRFIRLSDASRLTNLTEAQLRYGIRKGRLASTRRGVLIFVDRDDLTAFAEKGIVP